MKSFYQTVDKSKAQTIKNVNDLYTGIQYYEVDVLIALMELSCY